MRSTTSEGRDSQRGWSLRREWAETSKSSIVVFILLALCVTALWAYAITSYRQRHLDNAFASLLAIADLKVDDLTRWRQAHLDYGDSLLNNPATAEWLSLIIKSPADSAEREKAVVWLNGLASRNDFEHVLLVDAGMNVVLASYSNAPAIGEHARAGLEKAFKDGAVELSDLHAAAQAPDLHLDLYVPVYERRGADKVPLAALLFRIDPDRMLYPMIRSWPLSDSSGECLLVKRDRDEVVYLSRMRNAGNRPLEFRKSLATTNLSAALAVLGMEGAMQGIDYRGVDVLAVNRAVPDTGWWITVKKDRREIMEALHPLELLLTLTGVALINLALFAFAFSRYRQHKEQSLLLARQEAERFALTRHYLNLSKYANDIILLTDQSKRVIEANERALQSYGYSREEMLAKTLDVLWPPRLRGDCLQAVRRAESEHTVTLETTHCRADGSTFPVEVSLRSIDESGVKWIQAVIRDITERLQRRIVMDRYQALCRNARDIILFMNKDGVILEANEGAERAYEYTRDELARMRIHDIRAASHLDRIDEQLEEAATKGILFETEHRAKSGRSFPVEVSASSVWIGSELVILSIIRDISQRKRVEQALVTSEQNLKQVMDIVPQAIYVRNRDGRIILANRRFAELAGKSPEALVAGEATPLADQDRKEDEEVFQTGQQVYIPEATWMEDDGTLHVMQTTKMLFVPSGQGKPAVLSVSTDITESKRLQEQLVHAQKMESVGRLAGGIAHDFNNLLQAILGFNEILLTRMDDDDPGRQDAMEIAKAAKRAGLLTKQLLAYSRKQVIDPQVRDLNAIVEGASGFLKRLVGETIDFTVKLDPGARPVRVDVSQVEQALMNLVVNARDAMPLGGRITVATTSVRISEEETFHVPDSRPGVFVCLSVGDTGSGISRDVLAHIFEPFFTTKGMGKGTGLGLSMVYGIVKQHGGWINVYSQPKMGSLFRLYFPVADQPVEAEKEPEGQAAVPPEFRTSRILVVEDEDGVRQFAGRVLKEHGFQVNSCRNVEEALTMFGDEGRSFDLVFTDVILPDGNGVDLGKVLRSRKPDLRLLLTSGYMDVQERWPEIRSRRWLFLQKPYPTSLLIESVVTALKAAVSPESGGDYEQDKTRSA